MEVKKWEYNKRSVWLLKVAFLCSIFAFSGYNHNLYTVFQESVKTELSFSGKNTNTVEVLSMDKYLELVTFPKILHISIDAHKCAISRYNQLSNVAFKALTQTFLSYNCSLSTLQYRLNFQQQKVEEDLPNLVIG